MARKGKSLGRFSAVQRRAIAALKNYSEKKKEVACLKTARDAAEAAASNAQRVYKTGYYSLADEAAKIMDQFGELVVKSRRDVELVLELIQSGFRGKVWIAAKEGSKFYIRSRNLIAAQGIVVSSIDG